MMGRNRRKDFICIAFVHHANQLMVTNGYDNRDGISSILGTNGSRSGLAKVIELHRHYKIPINLHISGMLLESIAWHHPNFLLEVKDLAHRGLLEIVGSSYGQNMMRFFSANHNFKQLNEELLLYNILLDYSPENVQTFWVPERLWDTAKIAPMIADSRLPNKGYRYVIIDDRLLYSYRNNDKNSTATPRQIYDCCNIWSPKNFGTYQIKGGSGLRAILIANNLRQNIPPRTQEHFERIKVQLSWLADINSDYDNRLIAVYADDMEKVAGTAGWDPNGVAQFRSVLKWISENRSWIRPVKITDWMSAYEPLSERIIDKGSYFELAREFDAGESFENWYYDPRFNKYRGYYEWSEACVRNSALQGSDPTLIELAWKILLASTWQTAWHTPKTGAHGLASSDGGLSAWIKAISSHSRIAPIVAAAARWMKDKDGNVHVDCYDIDQDGDYELVIKNNLLFSVVSPKCGGRLVYLFSIGGNSGKLVVGNPIDDWNLLEELHEYMDLPANHPGSLSDVGCEHDCFDAKIEVADGRTVKVRMQNIQPNSRSFGLEKCISLQRDSSILQVDYFLPSSVKDHNYSTEIGLSPDYLRLLRYGRRDVVSILAHNTDTDTTSSRHYDDTRGWINGDLAAWVRLENNACWDDPGQNRFGHGYLLRVKGLAESFSFSLGVDDPVIVNRKILSSPVGQQRQNLRHKSMQTET